MITVTGRKGNTENWRGVDLTNIAEILLPPQDARERKSRRRFEPPPPNDLAGPDTSRLFAVGNNPTVPHRTGRTSLLLSSCVATTKIRIRLSAR